MMLLISVYASSAAYSYFNEEAYTLAIKELFLNFYLVFSRKKISVALLVSLKQAR
jgi:hypothetical protein